MEHHQDHGLVPNVRQILHKIKPNVNLDQRRHRQRHEEPRRVYVLRFIASAHSGYVGEVEVVAQAMHGALDTLMTVIMDGG